MNVCACVCVCVIWRRHRYLGGLAPSSRWDVTTVFQIVQADVEDSDVDEDEEEPAAESRSAEARPSTTN